MKVGIIRCAQTEDICPGTMCFKVIREKKLAFEPYKDEDIEIIGYVTCGGCPGKRAIPRAKMMIEKGADTIVISSCITRGVPIGFPCPFSETIKDNIEKLNVNVIDWTH
ncbi:MAG: CGGC domain protein [Candidatus Methanolliviera sp. GoM_oil]|nr:MAG: CGGC domain protein [Candidatus Methanolliviera sp. GoM_oil]